MRSFAQRPATRISPAEALQAAQHLHSSTFAAPCQRCFSTAWLRGTQTLPKGPTPQSAFRTTAEASLLSAAHLRATVAHRAARLHFSTGSCTYEVIEPAEVSFIDAAPHESAQWNEPGSAAASAHGAVAYESTLAWRTTRSPALPSTFTDVEELDPFARSRMLGFVRRYRTADSGSSSNNTSSGLNTTAAVEFETAELPTGGVFHARLRLPVTPAAASFLGCSSGDDASADAPALRDGLWAHGVANTAKDAELLAAMHAERMADLLGYHLYSLPSRQRKHAEAARQAGRYASSPDDTDSGPSPQERRAQWPLPLRRVLTDEETEGGKWQLVNTSPAATRFLYPDHTLLSPCLLDPNARVRIEAKFAVAASRSCPSFTQQLSVERVRTLTASSVSEGGIEFMLARLTLPPELTMVTESVVASGKAVDRATAVLLACMHAELLLDTLHVPLFDDPAKQSLHTAAAWSFGRPAPILGAKPKNPLHVHLPDPLKQLVAAASGGGSGPSGPQRTAMRSPEEEYFHRHEIVTEQTGSFTETTVGESTAVAVLSRFLETHHAPRATAAFLQTQVAGRVRSTVLLPLPESYGIRGGVGVAANAHDADVLAAMHALDVLCLLGIPITVGDTAAAASSDAAWKAARRARIPDVPATVRDASTPSPPARRCSAKAFASVVSVGVSPATCTDGSTPSAADAAQTATTTTTTTGRRRAVKRARLASEAAALSDSAHSAKSSVEPATPSSAPAPSSSLPQQDEAAEREARLAVTRSAVDPELWDLKADSPDGYIMIAPDAQQPASAVAEYAIVSPRRLDKHAKSRIIEYLSTVGRCLEDVRVKQSLDEGDTEGRPRHRCALKLPLPSACGEPRLALGEANTAADAEHAACMHAELLLDALGVCLYTDSVKQLRHAEACAQWGRWAASGPGQEKPPTTPAPPPLRREYTGSLHWERKKAGTPNKGSGFANPGHKDVLSGRPKLAALEAHGAKEQAKEASATTAEEDSALCDLVPEADIDLLARKRVQYFLRHERLTAGTPIHSTVMGRGLLTHTIRWDLPIPARLTREEEGDAAEEGTTAARKGDFSYMVSGTASTRKDADTLSWMHAERLLDALGIPLFPNLPQLQAYHATQVAKQGRYAPRLTSDPTVPLPPASRLPIKPLRLQPSVRGFNAAKPTPPTHEEAASLELWEKYVTDCDVYITATTYATITQYFNEDRVPRTGDIVVDAALDEVEAMPVNEESRKLLSYYVKASGAAFPSGLVVQTAGELHHRVVYVTFPTPGYEYVRARGVSQHREEAHQRAAMHALAILRRIDPNYEDYYDAAKTTCVLGNNKEMDHYDAEGKVEDDDFDFDTFSTLPTIRAEAQCMDAQRAQRFQKRMRERFVADTARLRMGSEFSDDGKRRAVELYAICCGVAKPVVKSFVRLIPWQTNETVAIEKPMPAPLELEVKAQSAGAEDEKSRRVVCGATYATEISFTDEEGRVWSARGAGFGPDDNCKAAYDQLFKSMLANLPAMEKVKELLRLDVFVRPEEVPSVDIPGAVAERMQACLRNQKDLLLAESETAELSVAQWKEESKLLRRASSNLAAIAEGHQATTVPTATADESETQASQSEAVVAAKSAALLEQLQQRITSPVYLEKYALKRSTLSIAEYKVEILQSIRRHPVVIICGTTGCGKTTQVPQYILDEATQEGAGGRCRVVITQPRRLSAVSIARRVAEERMEAVGESTGFIIRFDNQAGEHITFVTTGILLRLLQCDPDLRDYTHVIIDEIHERDLYSDFLLVLLRDLVARRPDLRLILMSATLHANAFQRYFDGAPLIQVEGYMFPVKELFLEDLVPYAQQQQRMTPLLKEAESLMKLDNAALRTNDATPQLRTPEQAAVEYSMMDVKSATKLRYDVLEVSSPLDYPTVRFAIEQAARMMDLSTSSILVFLPGWHEIRMMQQQLQGNANFFVLPLHSAVGQEAQMRCFLPAPPGKVKVILSTNVAESGITIDDVGVVVDCGRVREASFGTRAKVLVPRTVDTGYDYYSVTDSSRVTHISVANVQSQSRFSQLLEVYASRANCVQRRGRVGRTRPGICIRLYSRAHFEGLHQFQTPEMLRTPLDSLCLTILALGVGSPASFLQRAMEPPLPSEVEAAMARLTDLGAVSTSGELTALGYRLSQLPVKPSVGKMILLGAALRCLDSTLTVAATTTQGDVFETSYDEKMTVRLHREDLSMDTLSDSLASLNAYNFWLTSRLNKSPAEVALSLQQRHLKVPRLLQCSHLKEQLFRLLVDTGFVTMEALKENIVAKTASPELGGAFVDVTEFSRSACDVGLVKAVIAAACFPNIGLLAGERVLRTNFETFVRVSSESVLHRSNLHATSNPFLVYGQLNRLPNAKTLTCQQITMVSFWTILFMGTRQMSLEYKQDLSLCVVDGWIYLRVSFRVLELVRRFKTLLDRRLNRKFVCPSDPVNNAQLDIMAGILSDLLNTSFHPCRNLHPELEWGEKGTILHPEYNYERFKGSKGANKEGAYAEEDSD